MLRVGKGPIPLWISLLAIPGFALVALPSPVGEGTALCLTTGVMAATHMRWRPYAADHEAAGRLASGRGNKTAIMQTHCQGHLYTSVLESVSGVLDTLSPLFGCMCTYSI